MTAPPILAGPGTPPSGPASPTYRRDKKGEVVHRSDCRTLSEGQGSAWDFADGLSPAAMMRVIATHAWLKPCKVCRPATCCGPPNTAGGVNATPSAKDTPKGAAHAPGVPAPPAVTCGEWTFTLPITKPLSMNDRAHWRVKAKATQTVREAAALLARSAGIPPLPRCSIELHYAPRDKRRRDRINLAATVKPVEDGIVDAGVVPDDTEEFVVPTHAVIDPPSGGPGRLYVVVREVLT